MLLIHRKTGSTDDWVLPGGTPRAGESTAACARRETREETSLLVDPARVAFVLEVVGPHAGERTIDIVFAAGESLPGAPPEQREPGMEPQFVPIDEVPELDLRPPLAGHLRGMLSRGARQQAPYLANLWRPPAATAAGPAQPAGATDPEGTEPASSRASDYGQRARRTLSDEQPDGVSAPPARAR